MTATSPLAGIRVLDLSRVLAGPWCTQTLADLGAEVIKIERPGTGDDTRHWGPPYIKDADGNATTEAAYFMSANRGKKSVTVDMAMPEGQKLLRELAAKSDIVIENFKVGSLEKFGLDYASLSAVNPRLIYCSISGFGQTGPYRDRPGYDFMVQALGGLMSITGEPDSKPGGGPVKVGVAVTDILSGLYASIGILGALQGRTASGRGMHIDISLLDVQVATLANQALNYLASGVSPVRMGNAHPNIVPYDSFKTADGHIILAVGNDGQFARFCKLAGHDSLAADARYKANPDRVANRAVLIPIVAGIMQTQTTAWWLANLNAANVPCGPVNTLEDVFADEQVQARGLRLDLPHAIAGTVPSVASPLVFDDARQVAQRGPPALGEHTDEVLENVLNLNPAEIAALRGAAVV
jgi:crotonobetainyl-CoA:carnitine CoA-transferase CaiB-like acyl-CoA transferase